MTRPLCERPQTALSRSDPRPRTIPRGASDATSTSRVGGDGSGSCEFSKVEPATRAP